MKQNHPPAFTLVELLASISVLFILMTVMTQTVGMVSSTWHSGKARIDAFTQARTTLGMLDRDLQRIVLRPDLAAFADQSGANGALAFYTRVKGDDGNRGVSLVHYQVLNPSSEPRLVRSDFGLDFEIAPRIPTYGKSDRLPDLANVEPKELAPGVVTLTYKFIDGTGAEKDRFSFNYNDPQATSNTRILRVSLLVLDTNAYELLKNSGQFSTLLTDAATPPQPGETQGELWERLIESSALSDSLPPPVLKSLKVFERTYTIPVNR